jgi:hypothetical protein
MSQSEQSLRTIFNEALEIAEAQRRADYLALACRILLLQFRSVL